MEPTDAVLFETSAEHPCYVLYSYSEVVSNRRHELPFECSLSKRDTAY